MAVEIPGLSLSVLRQETRIQAGRPLLISGRFTAFGLGWPGLIRVILEGPSYDPQVRSFDTFASPFSGDYSVNVIAEKDGRYEVYSRAFPLPALPTGPPFPDALLLLPPVAESTHPPLVVGRFIDTGVEALLPDGTRQYLEAPPIEFRPIITVGAPALSVTIPGIGQVGVPLPFAPPVTPPVTPPITPPIPIAPPEEGVSGSVEDINLVPMTINPGQEATGVMTWRNTGDSRRSFDAVVYLVDQRGATYGPLQATSSLDASPQVPQLTNLRLPTQGLASGNYSARGELYDTVTGQLVDARNVPFRLTIREIAPPEIPIEPPIVPPPTEPTADILGLPIVNLPSQVSVGDMISGSVSLPTFGTVPYYLSGTVVLIDPNGMEITAGQAGLTLEPGQNLYIPVDVATANLIPGTYDSALRVSDQFGAILAEFPLGLINLLEAVVPVPPVELPTAPTREMVRTPILELPSQVDYGEIWQGNIRVPTTWPLTLPQVPGIPSYGFGALLQLESPVGQRFNVTSFSNVFTPGGDINIPVNFDTGVLPGADSYNLLLSLTDPAGFDFFEEAIGMLQVLGIPEVPVPPAPSEISGVLVEISPQTARVGDTVSVPFAYTHVGAAEIVTLRAAIGNIIVNKFDEIWAAQKTMQLPDDPVPRVYRDSIDVPITYRLTAPGTYDVYAKVSQGVLRETISPFVSNVIQIEAEVPEVPELLPSQFTRISTNVPPQQLEVGDTLRVPISYSHIGRAESARLYAAIGNVRTVLGRPIFDEILRAAEPLNVPDDATEVTRGEEIEIPITSALSPGRYDVYAKVDGLESEYQLDVVEMVAPPEFVPSTITSVQANLGFTRVTYGDTLSVPVSFVHYGELEQVRVYAAIGRDRPAILGGFNEVLAGYIDMAVRATAESLRWDIDVPIQITRALSPGTYDVYAKVQRIYTGRGEEISPPVTGVVEVYEEAPPMPSQFSNLTLSYPQEPIPRGLTLAIGFRVTHQGDAENEYVSVSIGNRQVGQILANRKLVAFEADPEPREYSDVILIPVASTIPRGNYDLQGQVGLVRPKVQSPQYRNVIRIT